MLFNSAEFIAIFLPLTALFFALAARQGQPAAIWTLALASLAFYAWWNPPFILLIGGSIVVNFLLVRLIQARDPAAGKPIMLAGVALNVAVLVYFKYAVFLVGIVAPGADTSGLPQSVPLALSFTTFVQISFLVDSWRQRLAVPPVGNYTLFVAFFPHLIAGPIVRWSELGPQIADPRTYRRDWDNIAMGLTIFSFGLAKKVLLADPISVHVAPVFDAAEQGVAIAPLAAWGGALAYAMQLYFDFSGYSDMAVGIGLLFNLRLPINFNSPYRATSIIDFWRRWHMSLSRFLRDYVYIALGGNRVGRARWFVNLFLTMLIGGIWHGAGWTFVIWGALHGAYLAINHGWRLARGAIGWPEGRLGAPGRVAGWTATFLAVLVAWVFFRARSVGGATHLLAAMIGLGPVEQAGDIVLRYDQWMIRNGWFAREAVLAWFGATFSVVGMLTALGLFAVAIVVPDTMRLTGYREHPGDKLAPLAWRFLAWSPSPIWLVASLAAFFAAFQAMSRTSEFLYWQF